MDRSNLSNWILWMCQNPLYFRDVFGLEPTDENIADIARSTFNGNRHYYVPSVRHRKPSAPIMRGRKDIQEHLQIGNSRFFDLFARGDMPVWKEGKVWMAYEGRLTRWAKTRGIGRYGR